MRPTTSDSPRWVRDPRKACEGNRYFGSGTSHLMDKLALLMPKELAGHTLVAGDRLNRPGTSGGGKTSGKTKPDSPTSKAKKLGQIAIANQEVRGGEPRLVSNASLGDKLSWALQLTLMGAADETVTVDLAYEFPVCDKSHDGHENDERETLMGLPLAVVSDLVHA